MSYIFPRQKVPECREHSIARTGDPDFSLLLIFRKIITLIMSLKLIAFVAFATVTAQAATIYPIGQASTAGFSQGAQLGAASRGWDFQVNASGVQVTQLGVNAAIGDNITLTLWDNAITTELAQIVVASTASTWFSVIWDRQWTWFQVTPIRLSAGTTTRTAPGISSVARRPPHSTPQAPSNIWTRGSLTASTRTRSRHQRSHRLVSLGFPTSGM